ncbi:MAG: hypothetical protein WD118_02540 [Phycisphaeraceae bacterium]
MLMVAALLAGGCKATQKEEDLPQLDEIRSRVTPVEPPEREGAPVQAALATMQHVVLPLNASLDESWDSVDESVLSDNAREVWNANGLRVGVVAAADAAGFFERAPRATGVNRSQRTVSSFPSAIRTSPRLSETSSVQLVGLPGAAEGEETIALVGGRIRLLMAASSGGAGVELLPHHQKRRNTLLPRDPLEKELDGRLLDELAVTIDLRRDQVLVIGLHRPWPTKADEHDDTFADMVAKAVARLEADDASAWTDDEAEQVPDLPVHLGRLLFTSRRSGRASQSVLMIHMDPVAASSATPARGVEAIPDH